MPDIYAKTRTVGQDTKLDLYGKQGATWIVTFTFPVGSLFGKSVRGQVRKTYSSTAKTEWAFSVDPTNTILTATMSSAKTETFTCGTSISDLKSEYVYDIEIYSGVVPNEVVSRSINGKLFIDPQVTK